MSNTAMDLVIDGAIKLEKKYLALVSNTSIGLTNVIHKHFVVSHDIELKIIKYLSENI